MKAGLILFLLAMCGCASPMKPGAQFSCAISMNGQCLSDTVVRDAWGLPTYSWGDRYAVELQ
jgi:hypothetical protein